jgi:hypothetical protein
VLDWLQDHPEALEGKWEIYDKTEPEILRIFGASKENP